LEPLAEFGRNTLPDQIKVIAAVWTDGETLGAPASVNSIRNTRACAPPKLFVPLRSQPVVAQLNPERDVPGVWNALGPSDKLPLNDTLVASRKFLTRST
jgi:hypothetical protein